MIKNPKQAAITKAKLGELKNAKSEFEAQQSTISNDEYILGINSFENIINDLEHQLQIYNAITEGNLNSMCPNSLEELPNILIAARIAQNLTHEELGKLLDLKGQQIQRYEATNYESASFLRLVEVVLALKIDIGFNKVILKNNLSNNQFKLPSNMDMAIVEKAQKLSAEKKQLMFLNEN